jgi:hypothetical protein
VYVIGNEDEVLILIMTIKKEVFKKKEVSQCDSSSGPEGRLRLSG